eukprot:m.262689 g.262689  ORF g.262689 m.262689 type:complete len:65 (+) comp26805_c2_seq2:804-998(+)
MMNEWLDLISFAENTAKIAPPLLAYPLVAFLCVAETGGSTFQISLFVLVYLSRKNCLIVRTDEV